MKKCPTLLVTGGMKIKIIVKNHFICLGMSTMKITEYFNTGKDVEQ